MSDQAPGDEPFGTPPTPSPGVPETADDTTTFTPPTAPSVPSAPETPSVPSAPQFAEPAANPAAQAGAAAAVGAETPPGWYPAADGTTRWWDGTQWTADVAQNTAPAQYGGGNSDDKTLALVAHLGGIFVSFIVPLVIYLMKKDESPFVRRHAAEALNLQLTLLIAFVVSVPLMLVLIGFFTFLAAMIYGVVTAIIAAMAANKGEYYHYPIAIRFVS